MTTRGKNTHKGICVATLIQRRLSESSLRYDATNVKTPWWGVSYMQLELSRNGSWQPTEKNTHKGICVATLIQRRLSESSLRYDAANVKTSRWDGFLRCNGSIGRSIPTEEEMSPNGWWQPGKKNTHKGICVATLIQRRLSESSLQYDAANVKTSWWDVFLRCNGSSGRPIPTEEKTFYHSLLSVS